MLELIQKRFQTAILAVLVALLSAVFILQFNGPQSAGCGIQQTTMAARVHSHTITRGEFRAAYVLAGFNRVSPEQARAMDLRQHTLDGLIERELLAHEAERMGFTVDATEVMREVAETETILMTPPVDAPVGYPGPEFRTSFEDRDGNFSAEYMRRTIQGFLRRSIEEFQYWQVREHLAQLARDTITESVFVSPQEVHDTYVRDTERAQISYVRFSPTYYRDRVETSEEAVRAWMEEHDEELDEEYQRQRHRYTGLDPQVRARHILIKASSDAGDEARAAARARAVEILGRIRGGEDFGALARELSEDPGSARAGGDLGWNTRGRMVAPFDEAQFGLETGEMTQEPVETSFGYHIIEVTGRREGDVPEEEAKRELAEGLYRRSRAGELAAEEARRALAYLRDEHTMAELDERLLAGWAEAAPAPEPEAEAPTEAPAEGEGAAEPEGEAPEEEEAEPERDPLAPQVRESRTFGRTDTPIPGPFDAGALTRAVFERTLEEPLPEEPVQLGQDYFVFQLTQRTEATEEGFTDEVRERIESSLLADKRAEAIRLYVLSLREQAREAGELRIDESILRYEDEEEEDEEAEEGDEEEDEADEEEEEEEESGDEESEEEEASLAARPHRRRA